MRLFVRVVLFLSLFLFVHPAYAQSVGLRSATANAVLPAGHWTWPLTQTLIDELHTMMDSVMAQTRLRYGVSEPKTILLVNSASLLGDFAAKARENFPEALVVGVGTGNENYNPFTTEIFAEHAERSVAMLALGGTEVTRVYASGQKNVGQGADAQVQITAGMQIAQDLKQVLDPNKTNLVLLFGPGHTPNHKLVLCGFKLGISAVSNLCDPSTPDNPELTGLPQLPSYVHVVGASGYYGANTVVGSSVVGQSVVGLLIQGNFDLALAGLSGVPTVTNISTPIQQITQELGGAPNHVFLIPGHPTVGSYEVLRQKIVTLLPQTTIFGHEGGGEIGHMQTTSNAVAVTNHVFMAGLRGTERMMGDANGDGRVTGLDYVVWTSNYNTQVSVGATKGDFTNDGNVDASDYMSWKASFLE